MARFVRLFLPATLALIWVLPSVADAQPNCRTGKPCGNTCIARDKVCRIGTPSTTPPAAAQPPVPADAQFVASSRGRVYYWIGCSAWRQLAPSNLRFFTTRQEAQDAGYSPSQSAGCAGPNEPELARPAPAAAPLPGGATCIVASVIDGDTFDCADGRRVRLLLVDAPEMDQGSFGSLAKSVLERNAAPGAALTLELDVSSTDQYGRTLAYVRLPDGTMLNHELLRSGVAVVEAYAPNVKYVDQFRAIADSARLQARGLWAVRAFDCLPADHRAGRCN